MGKDLVFRLSPMQSAFVQSDAHICLFKGPMGEGKTFAGVAGLLHHAVRCERPIRGALIRDTHANIKISTAPDMMEILGTKMTVHDDMRRAVIHSTPKIDLDMFGIDDPTAMSKLQGPQYAIIWLEEPAPIIDKNNAGLPKAVFDLALARAARQAGTVVRVQITQNPADEDHWTEELAVAPRVYFRDPITGAEIIKEVFTARYGENKALSDLTRAANKAAFQNDPGKWARYIEGRAAPVQFGSSVTRQYNSKIHLADEELTPVPGAAGIRMWDAWHNPVCILAQHVPPGRLLVHEVIAENGIGAGDLARDYVLPRMKARKYADISEWRDIGDPTMRTPDQSTVQRTTAQAIETILGGRFEPGPTRWQARIDPLTSALADLAVDGNPKILISPTAWPLHRALNGGWHWKVDNNNHIVGTVPNKDKHSHIGDAFSYGVAVLFPNQMTVKKKPQTRDAKRIAMSYAAKRVA